MPFVMVMPSFFGSWIIELSRCAATPVHIAMTAAARIEIIRVIRCLLEE
jgi:hypothetical protein